jgi:hypothetical protein
MATEPVATASPEAPAEAEDGFFGKVLVVAWGAILIAVVLEIVLLAVPLLTGTSFKGVATLVADLAQKVSWSFLVCVGVALGTAVRKAKPLAMGVSGFIAAPLAFSAAKSVHKGASQALGLTAVAPGVAVVAIALLKAAEYGVLGWVLGKVGQRKGGFGAYVATGAALGVVFGSAIVAVMTQASAAPVTAVAMLTRGINEVLFPVGCSIVIYAAEAFGKRMKPAT